MASHQTIVVELGSSRIKVGFAGEPRPRRVLYDDDENIGIGSGTISSSWVNDGMVSNACHWSSFFQYYTSLVPESTTPAATAAATTTTHHRTKKHHTTVYDWEKTLYPLFSHIFTSILFISRPARHRILVLINDTFPPRSFHDALHRVLLDYLSLGGAWLLSGGVFEGIYHLLEGMPLSLPPAPTGKSLVTPPIAHLLVDIGKYEARVVVCVAGMSILQDTLHVTMSGYNSFLAQVLINYQEETLLMNNDQLDENETCVTSMEDANAIVRAWIAHSTVSSSSVVTESTTISVHLPSLQQSKVSLETTTILLPIQPLLKAVQQCYLDYSNPSSLIYTMLTTIMKCPIDYRKAAVQNGMLLGGGSVALRPIGLGLQLEMAARNACTVSTNDSLDERKDKDDDNNDDEVKDEKKDDCTVSMSSISRRRFQSLRMAVHGQVNDDDKRVGGIHIQYPDPFAADMVAWIGGSVMGSLGYSNYKTK
jgi:hypothetical protein